MDFDAEQRTPGKPLRVDVILDRLDNNLRDHLLTHLHNCDYTAGAIARAVTKAGHHLSENAVRTWRERHL